MQSGVLESTDEDIFIKPAPNGRQSLTGSHVIERHKKATSAAREEKLNAQLKDGISDRRQAPEGLRCGTTEDYGEWRWSTETITHNKSSISHFQGWSQVFPRGGSA